MKTFWRAPFWQMTAAFVIFKISLHLFTNTHYELHRDEMLYFHQGDYPAWGNASVPPFIGWVAYLVKIIFGYSVFGIRLLPALLGGASIVLIAKLIKALGGNHLALVLACSAFVLSPGFLLFDTLFTVNVFEQFFWLLLIWLFFRMLQTPNPKIWIWIGIISGIAFLNKYLVVYLLAGFFVGLLFLPQRKLLLNKHLAFAIIIGLLIISPNIYWQYSHGFPILSHISELSKGQMVNMTYQNFIMDLFDLNYLSTFFAMIGLVGVFLLKAERQYRYISIAVITIILLFLLSKGKAYYALGLFPGLFAISGYILEKYFIEKLLKWNYVILIIIIVSSSLALPFALPLLSFDALSKYTTKTAGFVSYPFSRWEDGKVHPISQVFSDMTGWQELVGLVHQAYQQIPTSERINCTIYAESNYGNAAAVHFYGKSYGLPDALTFADSYVLWAPDTITKGPIIYIHYQIAGLDQFFEQCQVVGKVNNPYFREKGIQVFLCQHPNEQLQQVYAQKVREEKQRYR